MERSFPREVDALEDLFSFVDGFLTAHAVSPDAAFATRLVAEELFTNFVRHNRGGKNPILLRLDMRGGSLIVQLEDSGVDPFDPSSVDRVDTARPLDEREPGGLGIHLIQEVFDDLRYEYEDGTLRVTAVKHLEGRHV
ncbi:MAG: ATP-binding protein [Candidatus Eisenbacteria bacterium]